MKTYKEFITEARELDESKSKLAKIAFKSIKKIGKKLFKKAPKKSKTEDPNITFVRNEIESKLGLNVEISNKKNNSGKITIKYKSLDQFELISKKLTK